MFEPPTKADLDRALSTLMHDARRELEGERVHILSLAVGQGAVQSTHVIVTVMVAADRIHAAAIKQAASLMRAFMERMRIPATEVTDWARPKLEKSRP